MSRIPQPSTPDYAARKIWRAEIMPAEYNDEVSDEEFEALRALVNAEIDEDEFELVDGPAW